MLAKGSTDTSCGLGVCAFPDGPICKVPIQTEGQVSLIHINHSDGGGEPYHSVPEELRATETF